MGSTLIWTLPSVTLRVVEPDTNPKMAVIVVVPAATGVVLPLLPAALLMVAMDVTDELQVTNVVRSWIVLSENVPVALNCWAVPNGILGFVGRIDSDTSVAGVIARMVEPEMLPGIGWLIGIVAVIVVVPTATGVALPLLPAALLMVAMEVADELQVADVVKSWVVLSENVPVALNCWAVPRAMLGFVGWIVSDTSVAGVIVRVVKPAIFPDMTVIVVVPIATGVALPLLPTALLMVAMDVADEPQDADVVRS
jgi:hypothetical protein